MAPNRNFQTIPDILPPPVVLPDFGVHRPMVAHTELEDDWDMRFSTLLDSLENIGEKRVPLAKDVHKGRTANQYFAIAFDSCLQGSWGMAFKNFVAERVVGPLQLGQRRYFSTCEPTKDVYGRELQRERACIDLAADDKQAYEVPEYYVGDKKAQRESIHNFLDFGSVGLPLQCAVFFKWNMRGTYWGDWSVRVRRISVSFAG